MQESGRAGEALRPQTPFGGEGIPLCAVPWKDADTRHSGADAVFLVWQDASGDVLHVLAQDGRVHHAVYKLGTVEMADEDTLLVQIESSAHARGAPEWINLTFNLNELGV